MAHAAGMRYRFKVACHASFPRRTLFQKNWTNTAAIFHKERIHLGNGPKGVFQCLCAIWRRNGFCVSIAYCCCGNMRPRLRDSRTQGCASRLLDIFRFAAAAAAAAICQSSWREDGSKESTFVAYPPFTLESKLHICRVRSSPARFESH